MSGFDLNQVFSVPVHDQPATNAEAPSETGRLLNEFLLQFRVGGEFIYR
jgi:DNA replication licensing factor MCM5